MRIVRQGKEYDYDYKTLLIKGDYHRALKSLSDKENKPMGQMIQKLIECYEGSSK